VFFVWLVFLLITPLAACSALGMRMPYIPSFLNRAGLGPNDLIVARPPLASRQDLVWPTAICAVSAVIAAAALCGRLGSLLKPSNHAPAMVLAVCLWQLPGVLSASMAFTGWRVDGLVSPGLDRYLLPLLPLWVGIALWSLAEVRFRESVAWFGVAVFGIFAVAGTRDYLVLQQATWNLARQANEIGVPNTRLEGGATWNFEHLFGQPASSAVSARREEVKYATGNRDSVVAHPWWHYLAPATDASYVVSAEPLEGFQIVFGLTYRSWLHRKCLNLYLMRRM
jgi:hypothetical protein